MYGTMIFLILASINVFSKDLNHLQAFLACENKIESFKKKGCKYQAISVNRAKRISEIEFFKVDCGKSKLKGFVTTNKCLPSKYLTAPKITKIQALSQMSTTNGKFKAQKKSLSMNKVSGDSAIKVNSSLNMLIKKRRHRRGH